MPLKTVTTATVRDALVVHPSEVADLAVWVQEDNKLYRPKAPGTGSAIWESGESLQDVVDDTTPTLGGPLDANSKAITNVPSINGYPTNAARLQLTDAASITTNAAANNIFYVTITASRALANPTNLVAGGFYSWEVTQGGLGSFALTYGNLFKFRGGAPTLTAAAGSIDVLSGYYNGTHLIMQPMLDVKA